eukprot:198883_1
MVSSGNICTHRRKFITIVLGMSYGCQLSNCTDMITQRTSITIHWNTLYSVMYTMWMSPSIVFKDIMRSPQKSKSHFQMRRSNKPRRLPSLPWLNVRNAFAMIISPPCTGG